MITLDEAIESAKLSAGKERILRQQHYEDLIQQLPEEERYSFTLALAELNIGPRTGHKEASCVVAEFLAADGVKRTMKAATGFSSAMIEDKLVYAAMHKDAQWWKNLKQKFKDWWNAGPEDEYQEEYGEPFPMREPGTEDMYTTEPEEVIGPPPVAEPAPVPEPAPAPVIPPPSVELGPQPVQPPEVAPVEEPVVPVEPVPEPVPDFGPGVEMPAMTPVESSNLEAIGYDPAEQLLYIIFTAKKNTPRTLYRYSGVSQAEYDGFLSGGSVGRYFHQNIRDQKPYTGPISPDVYGL